MDIDGIRNALLYIEVVKSVELAEKKEMLIIKFHVQHLLFQ